MQTELMAIIGFPQLPFLERGKIVGIFNSGDLVRTSDPERVGQMPSDIWEP